MAVVGGGIVGLAVARELSLRRPHASVCLLEREPELAAHQSGHNSGVIHSGVYYAPGSLKARLCVAGARELYAYCEAQGIAHARSGKLIVASDPGELPRLRELERRGRVNGVPGLRMLDSAELREREPHVRGVAGLHSPSAGVTSYPEVAHAIAREITAGGGAIAAGCAVTGVRPSARAVRLVHSRGTTETGHAVFCAGAWSDRLAVAAGASADPRIVPIRGAYMRLRPARSSLVRGLVYPVPDPALPFLGVHLTRSIDSAVLVGPTALIAAARDGYDARRVSARDLRDTLSWPGTWRMLGRWRGTGAEELGRAVSRARFLRAATRLLPELGPDDVEPAFAGVRAQAVARDGTLLDDFSFSAGDRALHVRNAPSPAATSCLAIARHIVEQLERTFTL